MTSESRHGNWSFDAAIDLIRSADYSPSGAREKTSKNLSPVSLCLQSRVDRNGHGNKLVSSLGDLSGVFAALGLPLHDEQKPESLLPAVEVQSQHETTGKATAEVAVKLHEFRGAVTNNSIQAAIASEHSPQTPPPGKKSKKSQHGRPKDDILVRSRKDLKSALLAPSTPERLIKSDGEDSSALFDSRTRRGIIQLQTGTLEDPTPPFTAARVSYSLLTPASITPSKSKRSKRSEPSLEIVPLEGDKSVKLIDMLFQRFPTDAPMLSALSLPATSKVPHDDGTGLHIFVDISNILIGLHDTLKSQRGLSKDTRIPREIMSFHRFSLILERRRPTAKRVVVGSDVLETTNEAQVIGYKTHILERVMKRKELTARQKYFKNSKSATGTSSGSDDVGSPGPARRVEQGVDEILHLQMSHSLLDAKTPSTIVLATGDAAEAEYSDGFLAMVERALERNWKVELVAFKGNLSRAYRNKEWKARWGDSFSVLELDDYAEILRRGG